MENVKIEKFFCNVCKRQTNHFLRAEHERRDDDEYSETWLSTRMLIVECCGCEHLALIKKTHFSEHVTYSNHPSTGEPDLEAHWEEAIYPPVTYRALPSWFDDLPDPTLQQIMEEIYKSLQSESHYLATFGSRTLIDRLILLTVGDMGNFAKGMKALIDGGRISQHERDILEPVINAGHAAAHRGWSPSKELLQTILDTVEGLIHRLLVQPKLVEELKDAIPSRGGKTKATTYQKIPNTRTKVSAAPKALKKLYDGLSSTLKSLGDDVVTKFNKHYEAYRRNQNFASVQIYNQKNLLRVYLNLDPEDVSLEDGFTRDVRQIGHYGTGNLEVTIRNEKDIEKALPLFEESYLAS